MSNWYGRGSWIRNIVYTDSLLKSAIKLVSDLKKEYQVEE